MTLGNIHEPRGFPKLLAITYPLCKCLDGGYMLPLFGSFFQNIFWKIKNGNSGAPQGFPKL